MNPDPFDLLGVAAVFDLDPAELERAYLARSAALHPDLAAGDADVARRSAVLNQSKRILEDPERRADALLSRLGGPTREKHKALPDGFLAEIMETREAVEEAGRDPGARARWEAWAEERRREHIAIVSGLFKALGEPPDPAALSAIRTRLNAWRYIERLIEQLDPDYDPARADFAP